MVSEDGIREEQLAEAVIIKVKHGEVGTKTVLVKE